MICLRVFYAFLLILLVRDDCGPIENIKKTSVRLKIAKICSSQPVPIRRWSMPSSATGSYRPPRKEIRVRESLRCLFRLILLVGGLPVSRGAKKIEFVKIEPKSQPELADQPAAAAPSEPIQPFPSQALGCGLALITRHQSS